MFWVVVWRVPHKCRITERNVGATNGVFSKLLYNPLTDLSNQSESSSLSFWNLCGFRFGIPTFCWLLFKTPVSRDIWLESIFAWPQSGQRRCVSLLLSLSSWISTVFTLNSTLFHELGYESDNKKLCWVKRLRWNPLNSASTCFWQSKSQSNCALRALKGTSHR
jgi:hypothetical protein